MKIGIIIAACFMLFATSNVYAVNSSTTTAGADVVITNTSGTAGPGGSLTFTPSPTTAMAWATSNSAYTLLSYSVNNLGNADGMAYCTTSTENNIFKNELTGTAPTAPTAPGTTLTGFD